MGVIGGEDEYRRAASLAPEVAALLAERITRPEVALSGRELEILETFVIGHRPAR